MAVTTIRLGGRPDQPMLLLGPAVGASVQALWSPAARLLSQHFQVVGWDLPGHGSNSRFARRADGSWPAVSLQSLTRDLIEALDRLLDTAPGAMPSPVHYAGQGFGGLVGLDLARRRPGQVSSLTLLGHCLPERRHEGAEISPTPHAVIGDRRPEAVAALRAAAEKIGADALAVVRQAHETADLDDRLEQVRVPLLAVIGAEDPLEPAWVIETLGRAGVDTVHVEPLPGVAQMPPAEAPERTAALIRTHALGGVPSPRSADPGAGGRDRPPLDAVTETLVRLALVAGAPGSTGDIGVRAVLDAARRAARAGASPQAIGRTLALAWGERDADGRLAAKVARMIQASRC